MVTYPSLPPAFLPVLAAETRNTVGPGCVSCQWLHGRIQASRIITDGLSVQLTGMGGKGSIPAAALDPASTLGSFPVDIASS